MAARSIRKSVSFGESDGDRALLDAIAAYQSEHEQSFSDLCKQALHQYLLSREPTQSVLLFMELQHQITQLNARVAVLESGSGRPTAPIQPADGPATEEPATEETGAMADKPTGAKDDDDTTDDPVLNRLGPLLEEF